MKLMFAFLLMFNTQFVLAQDYSGMDQGFENPFAEGLNASNADQPVIEHDEPAAEEELEVIVPQELVNCPVPSAQQITEDRAIAKKAYEITNGACDFRSNPHSYACTHATFDNRLFPFFPMDWWGDNHTPWSLQGEWFAVTYVEDSGVENDGKAFYMEKNPNSSNQPMGVINRNNHGPMRTMQISGDVVIFENWQGKVLVSNPGSLKVSDHRATYTMNEKITNRKRQKVNVIHYFDCVNFNRHDNMHLQCRWDVKMGRSGKTHMGYFGFLTVPAWEKFLKCGKR